MKNPFGAKITRPTADTQIQPFLVVFNKSISLALRTADIDTSKRYSQQVFYIDQDMSYMLTIANQQQADQIKKLQSVSSVGGINIDFERFQQILVGNI